MSVEQTLVLIKPDGVARGLVGEIMARFERRGLRLAALRLLRFDEVLVARHYAEHIGKDFFPALKEFIMSGPTVAMVLEGDRAIEIVRAMMGATKFYEAAPGTIRGDYANHVTRNLVHGSDSPAAAAREIPLFFDRLID
ncbi:MAG: nucleoside-diphosphate kinase [bacterium]|nr:nucleoside-diphosphate kinase [bacterium]